MLSGTASGNMLYQCSVDGSETSDGNSGLDHDINKCLTRLRKLRRKMKYAVYKRTHREHGTWYTKPLKGGALEDYAYVFKGMDATLLACQKAQELNEAEGRLALAA
jgi:hypothetical protein